MSRISAAGNLTIEVEETLWRLLINGNAQEYTLVEATPGEPLHYIPTFARKRRLPEDGILETHEIRRVVVGWSGEDASWHLGLLLEPDLAEWRGSKWCEIARWHDPDGTTQLDQAEYAGHALAETLARPFKIIPPKTAPAVSPGPIPVTTHEATAPREPQVSLPELPLEIALWTLDKSDAGDFVITRSGKWMQAKVWRVVWYTVWSLVFIVLAVATLLGAIAEPNPEFLPYLGLLSAAILVSIVLYTIYELMTVPDTVVVNPLTQDIIAFRGNSQRWHIPHEQIKAIYISQVVSKVSRRQQPDEFGRAERKVYHGELSVLLQDDTFHPVFIQESDGQKSYGYLHEDDVDVVEPLSMEDAHTNLQKVGMVMAHGLNIPCLWDKRIK